MEENQVNTGNHSDYIEELSIYLASLDIAEYRQFMDFCLRAPNDMRVLISEVGRLRHDIKRYREDIKNLKTENETLAEIRVKANKYDRLVEMLQPVDGGQYVNDVVEAFWKYLRELHYVDNDDVETKPSRDSVERILKKTEVAGKNEGLASDTDNGRSDKSNPKKRDTPILGINRATTEQKIVKDIDSSKI